MEEVRVSRAQGLSADHLEAVGLLLSVLSQFAGVVLVPLVPFSSGQASARSGASSNSPTASLYCSEAVFFGL